MAVSRMELTARTLIYDSDADTTLENDVAGGPCTVHRVHINNGDAGVRHVKLYDDAAPTGGTTEPEEIYEVPASEEMSFDVNPPNGLAFATALSVGAAAEGGKTMTTAPTSVTVSLEIA